PHLSDLKWTRTATARPWNRPNMVRRLASTTSRSMRSWGESRASTGWPIAEEFMEGFRGRANAMGLLSGPGREWQWHTDPKRQRGPSRALRVGVPVFQPPLIGITRGPFAKWFPQTLDLDH